MPHVAKTRAPVETFPELLDAQAPGEAWAELAARAQRAGGGGHVSARTIWRLRRGHAVRPFRGTLQALALALRCDVGRVRRAIEATPQQPQRGR